MTDTDLCCACFEQRYGFEPDMGDDVTWHPGICTNCGDDIIVFSPTN